MTTFSVAAEVTLNAVQAALGSKIKSISVALNEVTVLVSAEDYVASSVILKDDSSCRFEQLIDLCGVDYSEYLEGSPDGLRFCVVCHLLSVSLNQRVRLKVFAMDDLAPSLPSLIEVWSAANWFEREAFDLFGIVFDGHPDLRRILTDYGFVGHPFRKDFPRTGHVEMRFDAELGRIVYQPIAIEDREITPRIIRESNYGGLQ
jgi:NADH-quinone oxidoreductase subunit C